MSFGQNHQLHFDELSIDQGFPSANIWMMLRDSKGFMWFGTSEGLIRYDGINYRVFYPDKKDSTQLSGGFVNNLFEDSEGKFAGMMPASSLLRFGRERNFEDVRQAIEEGRVGQFPDLIGRERAVTTSISKRQALEAFEQTDADELPVVDEEGRLVGIVSRSKLSSGVLAAILRKVEE